MLTTMYTAKLQHKYKSSAQATSNSRSLYDKAIQREDTFSKNKDEPAATSTHKKPPMTKLKHLTIRQPITELENK